MDSAALCYRLQHQTLQLDILLLYAVEALMQFPMYSAMNLANKELIGKHEQLIVASLFC